MNKKTIVGEYSDQIIFIYGAYFENEQNVSSIPQASEYQVFISEDKKIILDHLYLKTPMGDAPFFYRFLKYYFFPIFYLKDKYPDSYFVLLNLFNANDQDKNFNTFALNFFIKILEKLNIKIFYVNEKTKGIFINNFIRYDRNDEQIDHDFKELKNIFNIKFKNKNTKKIIYLDNKNNPVPNKYKDYIKFDSTMFNNLEELIIFLQDVEVCIILNEIDTFCSYLIFMPPESTVIVNKHKYSVNMFYLSLFIVGSKKFIILKDLNNE